MMTNTTTFALFLITALITTPFARCDECPFHMDGVGIAQTFLPNSGVTPFFGTEFDALCTTDVVQWAVQLVGPPDQTKNTKLSVRLCQRQNTNITCKPPNEGQGPFFSGIHQKLTNGSSPMPYLNISLNQDSPAQVGFGIFDAINRVTDFNTVVFSHGKDRDRNIIVKKRGETVLRKQKANEQRLSDAPSARIMTLAFNLPGFTFDSISTSYDSQSPSDYQFCWNAFNGHMEEVQWKACTSSLEIPPVTNCTEWSTSSSSFFSSSLPSNTPVVSNAFALSMVFQSTGTTPFAIVIALGKASEIQWLCGKPSEWK